MGTSTMYASFLLLFFLVSVSAQETKQALSCNDHPLYREFFHPPLIRTFDSHENPARFDRIFYHVNFGKYTYRPRNNPTSDMYKGLDMFHNTGLFATKGRLSTLYFHRPAKIYMFVGVARLETRTATLPGWKTEGFADLEGHNETMRWDYGVFQKDEIVFPRAVYVFSKRAASQITLPTKSVVHKSMRGMKLLIQYHFLIAEADGTPYKGAPKLFGKTIKPNKPCPRELHEAWRAKHSDSSDPDVRGKLFPSWHPAWDPCFWCTYGHEHGASAKHLMGYTPTFAYAAWKNGREKESDEGFKSFVFRFGAYWVYINFHVQVGQLRRVTTRYHTIAIAITHAATGEKMLELTHKADFGFLGARGKKDRENFVPLRKSDEILKAKMMEERKPKFRSVNVINPDNPDPRFMYRPQMFEGVYEAWQTSPICSSVGPNGGIEIDVRTPSSGIKSVTRREYVALRVSDRRRNVGMNRVIRIRSLNLGTEHCSFTTNGGNFYTNPDGTELFSGPGRGRIRQFIKPGFKIMLEGRYEVVEAGLGLHGDVSGKEFWDHGFGMNPDMN